MTDLDRAFMKVVDEIAKLTVIERLTLIRQWPGSGRPELEALSVCMPLLLALPDDGQEMAQVRAALLDGIRQMTPLARSVYVKTVYSAELDVRLAPQLLDAVAGLVGVIDRGLA